MSYTLSEIRNGTGWPQGARFALVSEQPASPTDQLRALLKAGLTQAQVLEVLGEMSPDAPHFQDAIQTARDDWALFSNDELEIDPKPLLSPCPEDGGCWVSAWVWVPCEFEDPETGEQLPLEPKSTQRDPFKAKG